MRVTVALLYDIESCLSKYNESVDLDNLENGTHYVASHTAVAVAVADSITLEHPVFCATADDEYQFVRNFVRHLKKVQKRVEVDNLHRATTLLSQLYRAYVQYQLENYDYGCVKMAKAVKIVENECKKLFVVGWCTSSYDIQVIS